MHNKYTFTINQKMILFVFIFFGIPFLLLGFYWYNTSTQIIENYVIRFSQQMIQQMNDHLDSYFKELEKETSPFLTSPLVKNFLNTDPNDIYDQYLWNRRINNELFLNLVSGRTDVTNLSIVAKNGTAVSSNQDASSISAYKKYANQSIKGKNFNIVGIRFLNSNPVLTITRNLIDPVTYKSVGMLIIDLNYRDLSKMIGQIKLGQSDQLWVTDSIGNIIYHPDQQSWGKPLADEFPDYPKLSGSGFYIDSSHGEKKLVLYDSFASTGWQLTDRIPLKELNGDLSRLNQLTFFIGILLFILAVIVIFSFSLSLTYPITILRRLMKRAELGDLEVRAPATHNHSEINGLYWSFNKMVSEIKRLLEVVQHAELKEKEMELKQMESKLLLLQSQINPHFMYNSLEVVNSYAIEAGIKPISKMVNAIAKLLRFNLGELKKPVSLAEEFEHLLTYLGIQKERYGNLTLDINVDDEVLRKVETVRLSLQPVVENAFKHGYEKHGLKSKYIGVSGRLEKNAYVLTIKDAGKGMETQTKEMLNTLFKGMTNHQIVSESRFLHGQSIGLWNVHSRLRLTFGEPFGLNICESDANGTVMDIMLPRGDIDV
ncbi:Histidine kinase [Paenibacillus sp. yr247]|uniref:sensor histidine kinase n=1 Tax=Paenibacillus sp. yr247 TaxID=1761880 RepID=UPI00087FF7BC|nr:sensor histidine kinase [Paenibacillus sp. yr247]SDO37715.1 Histidine kinase [Paenibacillus sp. yr247]